MPNMKFIVNLSYGLGSFCAAKRTVDEVGADNVLCVFADTKYEDEDTYAWGRAAAKVLGCEKVELADGPRRALSRATTKGAGAFTIRTSFMPCAKNWSELSRRDLEMSLCAAQLIIRQRRFKIRCESL